MQGSRVSPRTAFPRNDLRKALRRFWTPLLLPLALLMAAAFVLSLGGPEESAGPRAGSAATMAAQALAGEFFVLDAALP